MSTLSRRSSFCYAALADLQAPSARYVAAHRRRAIARIEATPSRRPFPLHGLGLLEGPPRARMSYLRRTSEQSMVSVLGHIFTVHERWVHRLVRCEVDLDAGRIAFMPCGDGIPSNKRCCVPRRFACGAGITSDVKC